jgi:hypothetical protein
MNYGLQTEYLPSPNIEGFWGGGRGGNRLARQKVVYFLNMPDVHKQTDMCVGGGEL